MTNSRRVRDNKLLDAVEALPTGAFSGPAWRVAREGRDPIQCSAVGGRWDDRSFEVLYTSAQADGAIAEMYFHVGRGQPLIPSQVRYYLYELAVSLVSCVRIESLDVLQALGLQTLGFGQVSYFEREQEYPRTQEIAEVAHFLGRDGMIVPSARSSHQNIIVFCEPAGPAAVQVVGDRRDVVWEEWRKARSGNAVKNPPA